MRRDLRRYRQPFTQIIPVFVILAASTLQAGCKPDLGLAPFRCNRGIPTCPDNYHCVGQSDPSLAPGVCVKDGTPDGALLGDGLPRPDTSIRDGEHAEGPPTKDHGPTQDTTPPPPQGKVVITEFMADPIAVTDTVGEYIELYNPTQTPVDLQGWTLRDDATDSHTIAAPGGTLIVGPRSFIVLGKSTNKAVNGGVTVAYAYTNFFLSNTAGGDEIVVADRNKTVVDRVTYSLAKEFSIPIGASLSVKNPLGDKSKGSQWCAETKPWVGSAGDKGTPGLPPGC